MRVKGKDLVNPFLASLSIKVNRMKTDNVHKNTGKPHEMEFEATPLTKVYILAKNRKDACGLTPAAKSLFVWVLFELDKTKDYIWLNKKRFMKENNIRSPKTVRAAIVELSSCNFINRMEANKQYYWINPSVFFHGSRINRYPDNIDKVIVKDEKKE